MIYQILFPASKLSQATVVEGDPEVRGDVVRAKELRFELHDKD